MTIPMERVENWILSIRGHRVMLDADLAELYGVPTKRLNEAVRRNAARFPEDFMFQLNWEEARKLSRSRFVTLKRGQNPKYRPYVFTEQGVAMLSSVLRSKRAIAVNIAVMRAFVQLRAIAYSHAELSRRLEELERRSEAQFKVDSECFLSRPPHTGFFRWCQIYSRVFLTPMENTRI